MNELAMNEFQEAILDELMVADKIGDYWKPGPLLLAVQALRKAGLTTRDDPGSALGFPPVLCAAVQGAFSTVRHVDDARTLAVSLFTEVAPRSKAPKLRPRQLVAVALWSLRRVPDYCHPANSLAGEVFELLEDYVAGGVAGEVTIQRVGEGLARAASLVEATGPEFTPRRLALTAHYFAVHTVRRAHGGDDAGENAALVMRDVGRLAGLVHGVAGAVPYCVDLARQVGM